jgi:hypothetical protein
MPLAFKVRSISQMPLTVLPSFQPHPKAAEVQG